MKSKIKQQEERKFPLLSFTIIIFFLSALLFLSWQSKKLGLPISAIMIQFKDNICFSHYNNSMVGAIKGANVLKLYYEYFALVILLSGLGYLLVLACLRIKTSKEHFLKLLSLICFILLFVYIIIQETRKLELFMLDVHIAENKSSFEKNILVYGPAYEFAALCKSALKGFHRARLLTDIDLDQEPYIFQYRYLAYLLYPGISLRFENKHPEDSIILFYKNNPLENIPPDYKILVVSDDKNYILAVKRNLIDNDLL